ncbi:hypothetical protein E4U53_001340 [Claviceps sorghi]|nr:hypothetical protein E4U53_001340 [Claviceps sorghi]
MSRRSSTPKTPTHLKVKAKAKAKAKASLFGTTHGKEKVVDASYNVLQRGVGSSFGPRHI